MSSATQTVLERAVFKKLAEIVFTILLVILIGLVLSLIWVIIGALFSVTIVGIPLGKKCFTIAKYAFSPSKKVVSYEKDTHKLANLIWFPFGLVVFALTFVLTAIAAPFAVVFTNIRRYYKLWKMSFKPFNVIIEKVN
ncbi:MAG: YccF domain-containing protein [Spirochaetales bacterium]